MIHQVRAGRRPLGRDRRREAVTNLPEERAAPVGRLREAAVGLRAGEPPQPVLKYVELAGQVENVIPADAGSRRNKPKTNDTMCRSWRSSLTMNTERSSINEASDTVEAIEECYRLGWSDGLPVVPPVDYKVREMLEFSGLTGEEELLSLDMRRRVLTSENAAANAVMAGCLPEYFPVLTTTLRALDEEKNYVNMAASSTSSRQY